MYKLTSPVFLSSCTRVSFFFTFCVVELGWIGNMVIVEGTLRKACMFIETERVCIDMEYQMSCVWALKGMYLE